MLDAPTSDRGQCFGPPLEPIALARPEARAKVSMHDLSELDVMRHASKHRRFLIRSRNNVLVVDGNLRANRQGVVNGYHEIVG
ncbi:MAG: hypothetical protein E6P95_01870 [Candidatus Moraniibacteriota bacterium]|nr:MAG: hypothetical protein E6P95_01870 [Candidatus Moranbacteria bacterium]